jgi:hypothetical protein
MQAPDDLWFDHEKLVVRMLMGLIKRNSTRGYEKGSAVD